MTLDEFRKQMEEFHRSVDDEAMSMKDSYLAVDRMFELYKRFDPEERVMADQVLAEWALSEDETIRFDAQALIRKFKITSAIPALQKLAERLAVTRTPGAPYELQIVKRLIGILGGVQSSS
jgi:hypothetical protein